MEGTVAGQTMRLRAYGSSGLSEETWRRSLRCEPEVYLSVDGQRMCWTKLIWQELMLTMSSC